MVARREALDAEAHAAASAKILERLELLITALTPASIGFCWPLRAEVDLRPLLADWQEAQRTAALPVVVAPGQPLAFRRWQPGDSVGQQLAVDRYGIPFPRMGENLLPEWLLIPVNAVDRSGARLGYGGGYFDRTLAQPARPALAIGVGFDHCRVHDMRPAAHDVPLDALVTEKGVHVWPHRPEAARLVDWLDAQPRNS